MTQVKSNKVANDSRIAENKKASYNYFFEEKLEAGLVLDGWEVKSLRSGKVQLTDGYIMVRNGELFLIGCQINALHTASTHVNPDITRTRKLLLHKEQIEKLAIIFEVDKNDLIKTWLTDKIINEIKEYEFADDVLKLDIYNFLID